MALVSVTICTHNPRPDHLARTLGGLQAQTLDTGRWQLLVVDNLSDEPLSGRIDLSWHPQARIVREENPGLTSARLCAIREAQGDLLVFVDDDNVLAPDYLSTAVDLFEQRPDLGLASGCILPEYETPPPAWFRGEHESWLAIRRLEKSAWSNFLDPRSEPVGAGLCLRRAVALAYAGRVAGDRVQLLLGRRGKSLLGGEDVSIAKTALAGNYAMGQFIELKATHLISTRRVQPDYLFSLYRHLCASGNILGWLDTPPGLRGKFSLRSFLGELYRFLFAGTLERRLAWERFQGRRLARKLLASPEGGQP